MTVLRVRPLLAAALALLLVAALARVAPAHAAPPEDAAAQSLTRDPLPPGTSAIVRANGDCLRVREQPGLGGRTLACLADGTTLVVLPSTQPADGYRWQLVNTGNLAGWVADDFLQPHDGAASSAACAAGAPAAIRPGLGGAVPTQGGFGTVVWGGGTLAGVDNSAAARGCRLTAVWTSRADGSMVGYFVGAPDALNDDWRRTFPDGQLAAGRVLHLVCDPPDAARTNIAAIAVPGASAPPRYTGAQPPPAIDAAGAVVIDEASGAVLFQQEARRPLAPASLTKIATAIVAIEGADANAWVASDVDSRRMADSSVMGLIPGDCFRLNDLLHGLLLPSGNDAARAIARYQAGSDAAFVQQMNTLLARLGLTDSHFTDADGLGGPQHVASAYDIAMLSRYAMSLPAFRDIVRTSAWTATGTRSLSMANVNAFLQRYPGADGVKTGYTEEAGRTLSASATVRRHRVYVVLLNDANRYTDAQALFDWAFANHAWP